MKILKASVIQYGHKTDLIRITFDIIAPPMYPPTDRLVADVYSAQGTGEYYCRNVLCLTSDQITIVNG